MRTDKSVLLVDDSAYTRAKLHRLADEMGWPLVLEAEDGDHALATFAEHQPRLVLIDQVMRGRNGIETAALLLRRHPGARIVMLTVVSDPDTRSRALEAGILRVLEKTDWSSLRRVLEEGLHG